MPAAQPRKVACPSCGAPLLFGAGEITTRCTFCHAVVERPIAPDAPATLKSDTGASPGGRTVSGGGQPASAAAFRRVVLLLGLSIVLGVGALGLVILIRDVGPQLSYSLTGPIIPYPVDRAEGPDFIGVVYDRNAETYQYVRLDPVKGRVSWRGKKIKDLSDIDSIAAGEGTFFAVENRELQAYNAADGSALWQAKLSDKLDYSDDSLTVAGDRVIALTQDNILEAFDAQTGNSVWQRIMFGYTNGFTIVDGNLWLVDKVDGEDSLFALSLADGSVRQRISPDCRSEDGFHYSSVDPATVFRFDPDPSVSASSRSLYVFYGWNPGCVERWDVSTGELLWQAQDETGFSLSRSFALLMTPETLYFAFQETLWSLSKDGGEIRTLSEEGGYELVPLALEQGVLILRTKRTRGTARFGLRGFDPSSGDILWEYTIEDSEPYDPPDAASRHVEDDRAIWTWRISGGLLHLYIFQADPNQLSLQTLDPKDGSISSGETIAFRFSYDSYFGPDILEWKGPVMWVAAGSKLLGIDLSAVKIKHHFP